jgi:hypothetical protein
MGGGFTLELIALSEHGDRLWKLHCASGEDAVMTTVQFSKHLNLHMRKMATPPETLAFLHSLFEKHGVGCPSAELCCVDTLLVHLHHNLEIKDVVMEVYHPYVVVWSRHIDYDKPTPCHLCHCTVEPVRHITHCCFQSYCRSCVAEWGRFHTQCPHCGGDMHFYRIQ